MDEKSAGYQKQETNLDHYKDEILEKCLWNLAVVKGKPKRCNCTNCSDCEFCKDQPIKCHKRATEWLKQLYEAPAIKLTKFEYDLLQSCSQGYSPEYQFKNINSLTEMMAFLETMDVSPEELGSILKHAAKAMLRDFVQQVVNLSESLEAAEIEDKED